MGREGNKEGNKSRRRRWGGRRETKVGEGDGEENIMMMMMKLEKEFRRIRKRGGEERKVEEKGIERN